MSAGFVYEDMAPADIASMDTTARLLAHPLSSLTGSRILMEYTLKANLFISESPGLFHVVNLCFHLMNVWMLFAVVWQLSGQTKAALMAAGLFALHPLNTQAVSYIWERTELMSGFGILLAVWGVGARRTWVVVVGAIIAMMSKPSGIVIGGLIPLVDWLWFPHRSWRSSRVVKACVVFCVLAIAYHVIGYKSDPLSTRGVLGFASIQSAALLKYASMVVWPFGFTIDHDWDVLLPPVALGALGVVIAIAAAAWHYREKYRVFAFVVGWTLIAMGPRLLLPLPEFLVEHHTYVPMMAWTLGLGMLMTRAFLQERNA